MSFDSPAISIIMSAAPLAASGTFAGNWVRVFSPDSSDEASGIVISHEKRRVVGYCRADQASAIDGLIIEQRHDGTVGSPVLQTLVTVLAATDYTFDVGVFMREVRVRYVNGVVPQTLFILIAHLVEEI